VTRRQLLHVRVSSHGYEDLVVRIRASSSEAGQVCIIDAVRACFYFHVCECAFTCLFFYFLKENQLRVIRNI
jgi:hypothetical protein